MLKEVAQTDLHVVRFFFFLHAYEENSFYKIVLPQSVPVLSLILWPFTFFLSIGNADAKNNFV